MTPSHTVAAQLRTARVLQSLLTLAQRHNLPAACWHISDIYPGTVEAFLPHRDEASLIAWATTLGSEIDWTRHDSIRPQTIFMCERVTVRIWTTVGDHP